MYKQEAVFKFKEVFNPQEVLSQWIIKLSMARNDFLYVHNRLFELSDKKDKAGENFYYFRIALSHYREAIKYIDKHKEKKKIIEFISILDKKTKDDYRKLIESCSPWDGSFVKEKILPVRNNLFHYYNDDFQLNLENLDDFFTRVIVSGNSRSEVDLVFADDVSLKISFGNIEEQEFKEILLELVQLLVAFIRFIDKAISTYLLIKQQRVSYFVRSSK
ncbi:hypothetical protein [Paenibacillus sp. R14(2021)]|uniref:hypothetical protein n=1 Tax=Paenibacillus sp. R14(2021) TaxID=2859228 RepID=UPI001C613830|nr:hypothetical protein [Paenibacillus sp. R14(2021)]